MGARLQAGASTSPRMDRGDQHLAIHLKRTRWIKLKHLSLRLIGLLLRLLPLYRHSPGRGQYCIHSNRLIPVLSTSPCVWKNFRFSSRIHLVMRCRLVMLHGVVAIRPLHPQLLTSPWKRRARRRVTLTILCWNTMWEKEFRRSHFGNASCLRRYRAAVAPCLMSLASLTRLPVAIQA